MANAICDVCGSMGLQKGNDGFHYCTTCGTQSQNFLEEDFEDFNPGGPATAGYRVARQHNVDKTMQEEALRKLQEKLVKSGKRTTLEEDLEAELDPEAARQREEELLRIFSQKPGQQEEKDDARATLASQFGSQANVRVWEGTERIYDASELESRLAAHMREVYLEGMQTILQLQCEALVRDLGVSPLVCKLVGQIWFRFLQSTYVLEDDWPQDAILAYDAKKQQQQASQQAPKPENRQLSRREKAKLKKLKDGIPCTKTGVRVSKVWAQSLQDRIPMRVTLSILFLAAHVAREPLLPSDFTDWATEGSLPFVSVYLSVEARKFLGPDMAPIQLPELEHRSMFMPVYIVNPKMVEVAAAHIASRLGLELPPVNFHGLSCRFIQQLGLSSFADMVLSHLERLYEWYIPEGLWLCGRPKGFPSRAYVVGMLVVTMKLLFTVDGHAQSRLYWPIVRERLRPPSRGKFQEILDCIEQKLVEDFLKAEENLSDYLNYCRDVVYKGAELAADEALVCDHLWESYEKYIEEGDNLTEEEDDTKANDSMSFQQRREELIADMEPLESAEWSRAPSAQKQALQEDTEQASQVQELQIEQDEEEMTSRLNTEEGVKLQECKLRILKSLACEMKRCGFKLIPVSKKANTEGSYLVYPFSRHARTFSKLVHGDYFILLFACARISRLKTSIVHKVVQIIEKDLVVMDGRVVRRMQASN